MSAVSLVPAVHRATHRVGLYLAAAGQRGLSQGEAHVLAQLAQDGAATIAELHRGLAHRRSTLTSILDRLADRGLVTREVAREDRRSFLIALTRDGRRAATRVARSIAALERAVVAKTTSRDVEACLRVLAALESESQRGTSASSRM
jgi:DNA-binding MarR family transcriptional regulator